jgi:hypothetical protein
MNEVTQNNTAIRAKAETAKRRMDFVVERISQVNGKAANY